MRIAIDAINLRGEGGTVTHLVEVLRNADPRRNGFSEITIFGSKKTLALLPQKTWLNKFHHPWLDGRLPSRVLWQHYRMTRIISERFDLLFVPGSTYLGSFRPFVTMFQNMLPFDPKESRRYGISLERLRLWLLRRTQSATFNRANGLILLTEFARSVLRNSNSEIVENSVVIQHGIDSRFFGKPRKQQSINAYSSTRPFTLLYVSTISVYKHQWNVVRAVGKLRQMGIPVYLQLIGSSQSSALRRLQSAILQVDPDNRFVMYRGYMNRQKLPSYYHGADAFVYASSCENLPNILLEAMAAGLPIACSNSDPMPMILGEAGHYFDPERPEEIAYALNAMITNISSRERGAALAYKQARAYSWKRCADETFSYLSSVFVRTNNSPIHED